PVVDRVAVRQRQVHRGDRRDADRARGQEVERIGVGARVVALEDVLRALLWELAQAAGCPPTLGSPGRLSARWFASQIRCTIWAKARSAMRPRSAGGAVV